jgi:TrmH family RNA methyltransferase
MEPLGPLSAATTNARALGKHNPLLKQLARLDKTSERREQKRYLIEGVRALEEAHRAGLALQTLLYDPSRAHLARHQALISHWKSVSWELPDNLLTRLSSAESSQGLLGVATLPEPERGLRPSSSAGDFLLVLDGVRDPGNLGTLLRTAWASQAREVVLFNCADPYSPKAVRSSAGGLFHVRLVAASSLEEIEVAGFELVALTPRDGHDLYQWQWPERAAWILGGEANGQDPSRLLRAPHRVTVPMAPNCDSLNVAATGAIVMFEHRRRYM